MNNEQAMAFWLIAEHMSSINDSSLKMFIGGLAGTGKSHVIDATCDFFQSHGEEWWINPRNDYPLHSLPGTNK